MTKLATKLTAIAATALTGLLAFAVPAHAVTKTRVDSTEQSVSALLDTARNLGIRINRDTTECRQTDGLMGYMTAPGMTMVLCIENHEKHFGPQAFNYLADTIRHELIHAAQFCKSTYSQANLIPEKEKDFFEFSVTELGFPIMLYDMYQWSMEGEARTLAYIWNDGQVGSALNDQCRYTDTGGSMVYDMRSGERPLPYLPRG